MRQRKGALLAATTGVVLGATLLVPSSDASWTDGEWNHARTSTLSCASLDDAVTRGAGKFLGGTLAGVDVDSLVEAHDVVVTHDGNASTVSSPSATALGNDSYANPLTVEALNTISFGLENLLALPLDAGTGVINQYGRAQGTGGSAGAAGAVTNSGGIDLGSGTSSDLPEFATLELGAVLDRILGQGTGAGIADLADARLEVGAVASSATLDSCDAAWNGSVYSALDRKYAVAGLDAELDTPLVGGLVSTVDGTLGALETGVTQLAGPNGAVNNILGLLLGPRGLGPLLGTLLINQNAANADLALNLDLSAVRGLITTPIQDPGETLSIDLISGTITLDLASLLGPEYQESVGLNGLAPNAQLLLNADAVNALTEALTGALQSWTSSVTSALDQALGLLKVRLHVTVPVELLNLLGVRVQVATLRIDVGGTTPGQGVSLAALRAGEADVSVTLARSGICSGGLGGALCAVLGGVISGLTNFAANSVLGPLIAGVLDDTLTPLVSGLAPALQNLTAPLVSFLSGTLSGLFGPNSVLSIVVNAQNNPDPAQVPADPAYTHGNPWPGLGIGQYDVAALRIHAVGALGLLNLDLARSSVGPNVLP